MDFLTGLLQSCLVYSVLTPLPLTKWLTQIFANCNRFNNDKINEIHIEWTLKTIQVGVKKGGWVKQEPN